jgi:hypothetical protein
MAKKLLNFPNSPGASSAFPYSTIVDESAPGAADGTPLDLVTLSDLFQLMARAMAQSGITPNDLVDNADNGWQLAKAFGLEAWNDGGTPTLTPNTGTVTVDAGDVLANRWRLVGRTLQWQIALQSVTVSGSPATITIPLPAEITAMGLNFQHQHYRHGIYNITDYMLVSTVGNHIALAEKSLGTFANGTNNQVFHIDIVAELA